MSWGYLIIIHVKNTLETINVKETTIDTFVSRLTAGSEEDISEVTVTNDAEVLV